jgi:predicted MFS family arabinose efflux permease
MVLAYPSALLPQLNSDRFGGSPRMLAYMMSAMALGGFLTSLFSGHVTRSRKPGLIVLWAATAWGVAFVGMGFAKSGWTILALMLFAGAADTVSVISRGIVVQLSTEPDYLGRVNAVSQAIGVAGPALGNFRAGIAGTIVGPEVAITLGGAAAMLGVAVVSGFLPAVRKYSTYNGDAVIDQ